MRRAVIIGGGISGLSTAYYLAKAGIASTLIERESRLGGVILTERVEGCLLEAGPDSFVTFKPAALALIREIGLGDQVIGSNDHTRATYIWKRGRLIKMPEGFTLMVPAKVGPVIATPLFGPGTKIKMAAEWFRSPRPSNGDRSVSEFVTDHYGREVVDYLTEPLLAGVYGGDSDSLSVRSVLPRMAEWEAKYGSLSRGAKKEVRPGQKGAALFNTLKGGLCTLTDELVRRAGGNLEVIHGEVEQVMPGYRVRVNGETIEAESVVLATPAWRAAGLLPPGELSSLLDTVPYTSSTIVALIYRREDVEHPMKGHGFLVPKVERRHVTACTWMNNKFNFRVPDGKVALRCFVHGDPDKTEDDIRAMMGITAKPVARTVHRWPRAMAQYTVGHEDRMRRVDEILAATPGLHLAGNAYTGIGIPDCVRMGKAAAERIARAARVS
jgi:protoporphyrinogen/coproporphyrinogen III oxidase